MRYLLMFPGHHKSNLISTNTHIVLTNDMSHSVEGETLYNIVLFQTSTYTFFTFNNEYLSVIDRDETSQILFSYNTI